MARNIFKTPSIGTILTTIEGSTGHLWCVTELVEVTGLTKPTVIKNMQTLTKAGIVRRYEGQRPEDMNHAPRITYEYNPRALHFVRLEPEKT
jgi:hypothetical protein